MHGEGEARADEWGERLPRSLGTFSAVAVLVGSTIGSGIFRSPAVVAADLDRLLPFMLAWIIGGLVALAGALTFAELGGMFPRTGGIYVYIREAFGELPAFLFGWAELLILRPAAYGAIAVTSAEYTWRVLGHDPKQLLVVLFGLEVTISQGLAALFIIVTGAINYRGVTLGAIVQNVSTALKVAAIVVLVALGLALVPEALPPVSEVVERAADAPPPSSMAAFGLAMVGVLWAYDGWSDVGFVGGEIRDPAKNIPRAFIGGTAIVVGLYLVIDLVYVKVVPLDQMPGRPLIAADVAEALIGPVGALFVAAAVAVSTFGTLNGSMMTGPRIFFAMAEDRLFFPALSKVHPVHGTPGRAIVLSIVLGVVFVSSRGFAELADSFVIGIWPFYALAVAAVIVLRRREPERERPYRTWGYPVVPLLFLIAALYLLGNYAVRETQKFALDIGIVLSGVPVYWIWNRRKGRDSTPG
ncbi:amino acid transporter [Plesiocystis pacifica SIR-1]|uniref:Amino acid transporter n=1 Tax=Plesiocystis pacifica SIR-1 TaxID=391625 RepID=A6FXX2_9BACT|nr:amino acid permease [Plesiocystis pacifica]EDM81710.1 amino acid transporter [Plesiocystis pacifica SIR-1]